MQSPQFSLIGLALKLIKSLFLQVFPQWQKARLGPVCHTAFLSLQIAAHPLLALATLDGVEQCAPLPLGLAVHHSLGPLACLLPGAI